MAVKQITTEAFEAEVLRSHEPVVVRFFVPGDHASELLDRVLRSVEGVRFGGPRVVSVDSCEAPSLVARYGVLVAPTLVIFSGAREVGRLCGLQSVRKVARFLEACLPDSPRRGALVAALPERPSVPAVREASPVDLEEGGDGHGPIAGNGADGSCREPVAIAAPSGHCDGQRGESPSIARGLGSR